MALFERTVPTGLGAEDKLIDLTLISLTVSQALNLIGGAAMAADLLTDALFEPIPLPAGQIVAGLVLLVGAIGAFWRIDGKSPWTWLAAAYRYSRRQRQAVSRPAPVVLGDQSDARWWYEVRPDLVWPSNGESR